MNQVDINNAAHYAALEVVENAVKNGVKIKKIDSVEREPFPATINPKSCKHISKDLLKLTAYERFKRLITTHKELTRTEMVSYSGLSASEVSQASTRLEKEEFIKKNKQGSASTGKTVSYVYLGVE